MRIRSTNHSNNFFPMLKNRTVQIVLIVGAYLAFANTLPLEAHRAFYTLSLFIKDVLIWLLPISVGLFVAPTIASFEKKAPLFLISLLLFEALSKSASVWYSYACGHLAASHLPSIAPQMFSDAFEPLWRLPLVKPIWWSAGKGVFSGMFLGLCAALWFPSWKSSLAKGKQAAQWIFTSVFSRLIPLFILGFVAKMHQTHLLNDMLSNYTDLLLWLMLIWMTYIAALFLLGSGRAFFKSLKNTLPALGMALSSGCSMSTMPWTIEGTAKNLQNPDLAKTIIPATTNIQQIGDCIANSFICFLIYCHFNGHAPDLLVWLPFSVVFVLARFATAAISGGAIFLMLPIYESYLGFTPEMIAIVLAFNVILDPLITCTNVAANSALCRVFEKTWLFLLRRRFFATDPGA